MAAAVSTAAIAALVVSVRDLQREVPHLAHAALVATGSMVGVAPPFVVFGTAEYLIIASGGYCSYVNADVVITYVIEGKFFKSRDYVYANMVPQVETPAAWYMALVFFLCNLPQVIVRASKVIGLALYGTNLGDARRLIYEMDDDDEESTLAAMLLQFPHTIDVLTVPASEAPAAAMPEAEVAKSFEVAAPAEAVAPAAASEPAAAESEPAAALALAAHVASSSASPAGAPPMKRARTEKESARPEVDSSQVSTVVKVMPVSSAEAVGAAGLGVDHK